MDGDVDILELGDVRATNDVAGVVVVVVGETVATAIGE